MPPVLLLLSAYVLRLLPRVYYLLLVIAVALVQAGALVVSSAWQSGRLWDGRRVLSQGQATVRALKCPVLLLLGAMLAQVLLLVAVLEPQHQGLHVACDVACLAVSLSPLLVVHLINNSRKAQRAVSPSNDTTGRRASQQAWLVE